ncbi:MAG: GNAT family N-acetyltransferase [Gammaproteobacteria bacterium]|nr:GNAT family N-acetyltransferase [Gammaproteobacteria bacterium]
MALKIRAREPHDRPAILACMREMQNWERTIDARLAAADDVIERLWREILQDCDVFHGTIFVAELDGRVVGYIGVLTHVPQDHTDEIDYVYAQVTDLVVLEQFRSQGIGTALLAQAKKHARDAGVHWLRINVLAGNPAAAALYRRCGFRDREIVLEHDLFPA